MFIIKQGFYIPQAALMTRLHLHVHHVPALHPSKATGQQVSLKQFNSTCRGNQLC